MASSAICLLLIQIYTIKIDGGKIVQWCCFSIIGFNILFALLKYRYAFPIIALFSVLTLKADKLMLGAGHFIDIILIRLDGRLLYTERFASITRQQLENFESLRQSEHLIFQNETAYFIAVVCVAVSFFITVAARGRFIGSVLIAAVIIFIPALGAEIATVVPALEWLIVAMFSLFSIWAGGSYNRENSEVKRKRRTKRARRDPIGGIAGLHRYAPNGILAFSVAFLSFSIADSLLPDEDALDLMEFFSSMTAQIEDYFYEFGENIGISFSDFSSGISYNFSPLDDSGYFPQSNIGSVSNSVDHLAVTNPSTGTKPVLKVTFEDNSEPVYLRTGIGITYNGDQKSWEIPNGDAEVKNLNKLLETYYPEHILYIYRRRLLENADAYVGFQHIETEYLAKTRNVMTPAVPYLSLYKDNDNYNWNLDTVLQSKKPFAKNAVLEWDILYLKMHRGSNSTRLTDYIKWLEIIQNTELDADYDDWQDISGSIFKDDYLRLTDLYQSHVYINADTAILGMTSAEYLEKTAEYEKLVSDIYTRINEKEKDNIDRLIQEILNTFSESYSKEDITETSTPAYAIAEITADYFKNNYTYSLDVNNNEGENTMLGNFLFETKSGHCALYATAMTLMMRELGYPTRYVTGYIVYPEQAERIDTGAYECTLIERNLHAWVEVYFEGLGWVPYDPTPAITDSVFSDYTGTETQTSYASSTVTTTTEGTTADRPTTTSSTDISDNTITDNSATGTSKDAEDDRDGSFGTTITGFVYIIIGVVLALAATAVLFALFVKRLKNKEVALLSRFSKASSRSTAAEMHNFIAKLLSLRKLKPNAGELPADYALRVTETLLEDVDVDFTLVMDIIEKLEFSREELSEEEYICLSLFTASLYADTVKERNPFTRLFLRIFLLKI